MYAALCMNFWAEEETRATHLGRKSIVWLSVMHIGISLYQFALGFSVSNFGLFGINL